MYLCMDMSEQERERKKDRKRERGREKERKTERERERENSRSQKIRSINTISVLSTRETKNWGRTLDGR